MLAYTQTKNVYQPIRINLCLHNRRWATQCRTKRRCTAAEKGLAKKKKYTPSEYERQNVVWFCEFVWCGGHRRSNSYTNKQCPFAWLFFCHYNVSDCCLLTIQLAIQISTCRQPVLQFLLQAMCECARVHTLIVSTLNSKWISPRNIPMFIYMVLR